MKRKPVRHWSGFFIALAALSFASASAQDPHASDYLAHMDAGGDGRIELAEYQDWLCYGFDAMDRDHDGVLSPGELPGGRGPSITRATHRARLAVAFARQDRNHDGTLDATELAAPPR